MSIYVVPALNAVDSALTAHTVPSIASPTQALSAYTVPALNAVNSALVAYTVPIYMDIGWELLPTGGITGTLAATEAQDVALLAGALGHTGTLAATEAQDVALLAGVLGHVGTLAATEAQDTASLTGVHGQTGTLEATEAQDSAAFSELVTTTASNAPSGSDAGTAKRRRRIQAEYKDRIYEFDSDAEARQFLLSLVREYKPSRAERKKAKPGVILTPKVEFTIDDVPIRALDLSGWNPLEAIMAGQFEQLHFAAQRMLDDDEEAILLLM